MRTKLQNNAVENSKANLLKTPERETGQSAVGMASRLLVAPIAKQLARLEQRLIAMRFRLRNRGLTDYRVKFDYRSLGKAKAVILWYDDWQKATTQTLDIIDDLNLVHDGDRVIDYGCGIGRITKALRERHDVEIVAVDRSAEMREHARSYLSPKDLESGAVAIMSDTELMEHIGLSEGADCILMIEVLQHIPEPVLDQLLPRLASALRPQGQLFVFGNEYLDVDQAGGSGSPVEPVLGRHVQITRRDRWITGFVHPRHSFIGRRRPD